MVVTVPVEARTNNRASEYANCRTGGHIAFSLLGLHAIALIGRANAFPIARSPRLQALRATGHFRAIGRFLRRLA